MASISIRQLARELNCDVQELIARLGKNSGSDVVDKEDALKQLNQPPRQQEQQAQQNYAPGMFGEVSGEFRRHVAVQGAMLALQGKQQLRQDVSNFWQMGEEDTRKLLAANGVQSPDQVTDTFDFFNKSQGYTSLDQMMNALGAADPTNKQLVAANSVSEPSTSQPEAPSSQSNFGAASETAPE